MWGNLQLPMHPSRIPSVLLYLSLNRTSSPGERLPRAYQIQLLLFHINVLMWNQNTNNPRLPPYPKQLQMLMNHQLFMPNQYFSVFYSSWVKHFSMFRLKSPACQEAFHGEGHSAWGHMAYPAAAMQSYFSYRHFVFFPLGLEVKG